MFIRGVGEDVNPLFVFEVGRVFSQGETQERSKSYDFALVVMGRAPECDNSSLVSGLLYLCCRAYMWTTSVARALENHSTSGGQISRLYMFFFASIRQSQLFYPPPPPTYCSPRQFLWPTLAKLVDGRDGEGRSRALVAFSVYPE